jgi:excisionase family DNA binding protein
VQTLVQFDCVMAASGRGWTTHLARRCSRARVGFIELRRSGPSSSSSATTRAHEARTTHSARRGQLWEDSARTSLVYRRSKVFVLVSSCLIPCIRQVRDRELRPHSTRDRGGTTLRDPRPVASLVGRYVGPAVGPMGSASRVRVPRAPRRRCTPAPPAKSLARARARSRVVGIVVSGVTAPQLLTAEQLASRWQVPPSHVYRLTREGRVPVVKLGRYYRYRLDAIERFELGKHDAATRAA